MSNSTTSCVTEPPPSLLPNITACQSHATTPFCWPPNGTRICVPSPSGIPFYWPTSFYPTSSRVLIEWDLSTNLFPARDNTGQQSQKITKFMYEQYGLEIPGAPQNEKSLKLYMRSRVGTGDVVSHEGPTLVLVKTAEWSSASVSGSSRPTGTRAPSYKDDDDKDPLSGLTSGAMVGIIIAILVAVVALITLCCCCGCCGCCGAKQRAGRKERVVMDEEEQGKIVARGVELMEQKKGSDGARVDTLDPGRGARDEENGVARTMGGDEHGDEIRRVELDAGRREEPPPRYTP